MRERWALFESPSLGEGRQEVRSLEGVDELSQLFHFEVVLVRPGVFSPMDDVVPLLEGPASLFFEEDGRTLGRFHGIVSEASVDVDVEGDFSVLRAVLVPRVWLLTQRRGDEIFLGRTFPEIVVEKLERIGLRRGEDFALSLLERYPVREYVAQHDETDWAFVSRLCEHVGIVTFFEHKDGRDVLVISDTPTTFRPVERPVLRMRHRRDHPAAYAVRTTLRRNPQEAQAHDYNYRTPRVELHEKRPTKTPAADGSWVEFGPHAKTTEETALVAHLRTEAYGARHHVVEGTATDSCLRAGGTIVLTGAGSEQDLLLTKVVYRFRRLEGEAVSEGPWENRFTAIPSKTRFRPARATPWPRMPGLVNAVVDGIIKGDYAELDEMGRYHLRMAYDRSGRTDLGATHPVRMMQPHSGANYGMHFPLRPGIEVLVAFVNGDPDRPVIVGTAPNPVTSSPVVQTNQTQNVLRTGSNNEMVIEDEHGIERIRLHTPHRNTTVQLGSAEEAEEGALTTTEANISEASRLSNNEATPQKNLLADTQTALLGRSAVIAVGLPSLTAASQTGMEQPANLSLEDLGKDLRALATTPEDLAKQKQGSVGDPGSATASAGGASSDPSEATSSEATSSEAAATANDSASNGLWSGVGAVATELGEQAAMDLVRAVAFTTDVGLDQAKGRAQGEPVGEPLEPAVIAAAGRTAALVGREVGLVWGDRVAALSSFKTASVMGGETAQLKSPKTAEVAAGQSALVTSAGTLDMEAKLVRMVGGYYPEAEAPPLDEGTTIGVLSRKDLRFVSVEDCILVCAKKNIIGTAHTGDIRLRAKKTIFLTAGSIIGEAGIIHTHSTLETTLISDDVMALNAANTIMIDSSGEISMKADGNITIQSPSITINGPVKINGDLTVSGAITQSGSGGL